MDVMDDKEKQAQTSGRIGLLRRILDGFGNCFGINICFVIGCLPVFTIGASLTAAYSMSMKLQEGKEEYVLRGFIEDFKRNFKQATLSFLIVIAAFAVMFAEYLVINTTTGTIASIYMIVLGIELVLMLFVLPFLFPLIARYENTILQTFKNAFLLSVGYLGKWLKIVVAWVAPIALSFIYPLIFLQTWYLWLIIIFGLIIYGSSYSVRAVFYKNSEYIEMTKEKANKKTDD